VATGTIGEILITGIQEINTPNAQGCATDRLNAIDSAFSATCTITSISVLDGRTLAPGVYCFSTFSLSAGASVTLDGTGYESPQWVFVSGTTFITGTSASIVIISGNPSNVFWVVGTSATIGANTGIQGTLLAKAAITFNTGASIIGHAIAGTAVTCASACRATAYIAPVFALPSALDSKTQIIGSYTLGRIIPQYKNDNIRAILPLSGSCRATNEATNLIAAPLSDFDFCNLPSPKSTTRFLSLSVGGPAVAVQDFSITSNALEPIILKKEGFSGKLFILQKCQCIYVDMYIHVYIYTYIYIYIYL
jgi:hypothetical protein